MYKEWSLSILLLSFQCMSLVSEVMTLLLFLMLVICIFLLFYLTSLEIYQFYWLFPSTNFWFHWLLYVLFFSFFLFTLICLQIWFKTWIGNKKIGWELKLWGFRDREQEDDILGMYFFWMMQLLSICLPQFYAMYLILFFF